MGSLYRRKLSTNIWCKYYVNGRPVRESTGTAKETEARRFLKEREGRVATGAPMLPRADRVRYEEAAADLRQHYEATGTRGKVEAESRFKHLDAFFRGRRVAGIGPSEITAYVVKRQHEGAANGTINRELGVLSRMLKLAYESGKLLRLPVIRKPKENGPRQGFFEPEQYEAVRRHLRPDLKVSTAIAYAFGWRMQSEVLTLERRQVDLNAGTLRLEPGTTKNGDGRVVYLPADLKAQIAAQIDRVRSLERRTGRIVPFLFPYLGGRYEGERIRDFRKSWGTACTKAGVAGRFRHDLRRTAVRNLVRAGVPERVAMTITGHRTRAVFDRYHIVSPADLQDAARKLTGTFSGTVPSAAVDARPVTL
jgi:integrase